AAGAGHPGGVLRRAGLTTSGWMRLPRFPEPGKESLGALRHRGSFCSRQANQLNGCGRGVLAVDGGRIGSEKVGCSPVRVFRKAVIWSICFFSSLRDRKSTRLNSSHVKISYAVFCLKK